MGKCRITLRKLPPPKNGKSTVLNSWWLKRTPSLGKRVNKQMNLITVHYDNIINIQLDTIYEWLITEYSDVFNDELGSLPGQVHL